MSVLVARGTPVSLQIGLVVALLTLLLFARYREKSMRSDRLNFGQKKSLLGALAGGPLDPPKKLFTSQKTTNIRMMPPTIPEAFWVPAFCPAWPCRAVCGATTAVSEASAIGALGVAHV